MKYHRLCFVGIALFFLTVDPVAAQTDTSLSTNQDAIYNRPFINVGKTRTAVGGYLEGNTNYFSEDGVSEGFSMEMRRFNIFLYSQVHNRIRFLSELEFEHGTEEIALETAFLDFQFNPAFNFRAGIILPALGLVNTNHDSPNWEFIERPLSSTELIPTTLSEIGFGVHGKFFPSALGVISYDAYIVNGLQEDIILNEQGRTHIPSGKSEEMFAEDNNGVPMLNARLAYAHRKRGEVGLSWYGGTYNRFRIEGTQVAPKRMLSVTAVDFQSSIKRLQIKGEVVHAFVDVPSNIRELYGREQYAGFVDLIYPVLKREILGFERSVLNVSLRIERVDYHTGSFVTNINEKIKDENTGLALGLGWRPTASTIIRTNYRYHFIQDNLGNPSAKLAGIQFGIASYF